MLRQSFSTARPLLRWLPVACCQDHSQDENWKNNDTKNPSSKFFEGIKYSAKNLKHVENAYKLANFSAMQKFLKKNGQQLFYLRSFETETYHQKSVNTKYKNGEDYWRVKMCSWRLETYFWSLKIRTEKVQRWRGWSETSKKVTNWQLLTYTNLFSRQNFSVVRRTRENIRFCL